MAEPCTANPTLARKIMSTILQALASAGQTHVATAIELDEATVSRLQSVHLKNCSALLAALELKVVPAKYLCYSREHVEHLEYFARIGMAQQTPTLNWEESEV